jgi:hypothetical protein
LRAREVRTRRGRHENSQQRARISPWRINELAPDFRLEDVWALPAHGGAEDFGQLLDVMASLDPAGGASRLTRALFSIRYRVGGWLGWDEQPVALPIPRETETTLLSRLPEELRGSARRLGRGTTGFVPLYCTDDEWAAELSNQTVHAVMHLAWVERDGGGYQGQMGIYVKPRGRLGELYMAAIAPFRHRIVYPAMMREIERAWNARVLDAAFESRPGIPTSR